MKAPSFWTPEQKHRAMQLRAEGLSARETAEILTKEGIKECTKGMVVGVWDRNPPETLDPKTLKPISSLIPRNEYFVRAKKRTFKEIKPALKFDDGAVMKIMYLSYGQCRYPIGELQENNFRFCCQPVAEEIKTSYCREHHILCHYMPRKFFGKTLSDLI